MTQAHNASQLLDITLRELSQNPQHLLPLMNSFIDQWVRALGAGNQTLDDTAYELEELKQALAGGKGPQIGESLHSLAKLAKRAARETDDEAYVSRLQELAVVLDQVSAMAKGKAAQPSL